MWGVREVTWPIKAASFDILHVLKASYSECPSSLMEVTGKRSAHRLEIPGS